MYRIFRNSTSLLQ